MVNKKDAALRVLGTAQDSPLDPETVAWLGHWMVKTVAEVMQQRGLDATFREAFESVCPSVDRWKSPEYSRLWNAAFLLQDDAVRIAVELMNTASVLHAVGQFPTPDEGQTD